MNEKMLHACRIAAKQSRYLAELATESAQAKTFVEELKRAQDEVGEWHDVLKLQQKAERLFGTVHDSALVAALQNISRARLRRAVNAMTTALADLSGRQPAASSPVGQKNIDCRVRCRDRGIAAAFPPPDRNILP
jgi:CHAD domain-containing protein